VTFFGDFGSNSPVIGGGVSIFENNGLGFLTFTSGDEKTLDPESMLFR
jgi:hypothetical protein